MSTIGFGDYYPDPHDNIYGSRVLQYLYYIYVVLWIFAGLVWMSVAWSSVNRQTENVVKKTNLQILHNFEKNPNYRDFRDYMNDSFGHHKKEKMNRVATGEGCKSIAGVFGDIQSPIHNRSSTFSPSFLDLKNNHFT